MFFRHAALPAVIALVLASCGGATTSAESGSNQLTDSPTSAPDLTVGTVRGRLVASDHLTLDADNDLEQIDALPNQNGTSMLPVLSASQPVSGSDFNILGMLSSAPYPGQANADLLDTYATDTLASGLYLNLYDLETGDSAASVFLGLFARDGSTMVDWVEAIDGIASLQIPANADYLLGVYLSGSGTATYKLEAAPGPRDLTPQIGLTSDIKSGVAVIQSSALAQGVQHHYPTQIPLELSPSGVDPLLPLRSLIASGNQQETWDTLLQIASLRRSGINKVTAELQFDFPEMNPTKDHISASSLPNDPWYDNSGDSLDLAQMASLNLMNVPDAWVDSTGAGVIVAVIDSAYMGHHEDMQGQFTNTGWDFVDNDSDPFLTDDETLGAAASVGFGNHLFHGTAVASVIAAKANNHLGGSGVAYDATIMPLQVFPKIDQSQADDSAVANAILYAAGLPNSSGQSPAQRADIINLSLGSATESTLQKDAITAAINAGVIVVAAAGNEGWNAPTHFPAATTGVIGVSAVTSDGRATDYSNRGNFIDLAAPGGGDPIPLATNESDPIAIEEGCTDPASCGGQYLVPISFVYDSRDSGSTRYATGKGTSFATPNVAGVAALLVSYARQQGETLTPGMIDGAIRSGKFSREGRVRFADTQNALIAADSTPDERVGYGIIDAAASIQFLASQFGQDLGIPSISTSISSVNLGSLENTATVEFTNDGTGTLSLYSATSEQSWLSGQINGNAVSLTVDRTNLGDGHHTGTLTVKSNGGDVALTVHLQQNSHQLSGDIGQVEVTVTVEGSTSSASLMLTKANDYQFVFSNIPRDKSVTISARKPLSGDSFANRACSLHPACWTLDTLQLGNGGSIDSDYSLLDWNSHGL